MSESDLPSWVQEVSIFAVASVSVIVAVYRYLRAESGKATSSQAPQVTAPTENITETKILKELIDALREHQDENARITLRLTRSQADLREGLVENTEILRSCTEVLIKLLRQNKGD